MKKLIFPLTVILILSACRGPKIITVPTHDSTTVEHTQTITDTPTWTNPESLLYRFAFLCDSNYNVLLKDYNELNTGIENKVQIKEVIRYRPDNTAVKYLEVDISILIDSIEVQNRTIHELRSRDVKLEIPYPVEVPVKFVPKYHKFTAWAFPGLVLLLISGIYLKIRTGKFLSVF